MNDPVLIIEKSGSVGRLIFNRPEVLNAYDKALSDAIKQGFEELAGDDSVRVIVVTGKGRAFMAGADLNMVNGWTRLGALENTKAALAEMLDTKIFEDCPKPTIAAINGLAFGMGCEIAMACDFRIAVENAKFGQPEIKVGIIPGAGGTQRLLRLVGPTKALELISTGEPISAQEALQLGLLNKVVSADKLMEEVEVFVSRLLDKGDVALGICKRAVYQGGDLPLDHALRLERELFCEILMTEDALEGTQAFLEKRKPQFKGR